jgi:signal transduction histidine kinase
MADEQVLRVLVADDEAGMRRGIARVLASLDVSGEGYGAGVGFEVVPAADGDEALALLAAGGVDIALLDHSMPGATGMEILERLREEEAEVLVIMITAYASLGMAVRATKQGAFDFLGKPFNPTELREVVAKAARHLLADRAARRLAAEQKRVRFEFLSVLAHELKAPLGAVEGYLHLLQDGVATGRPEQVEHIVGRSLLRLEGMRKLIYDLLDLTRIESGTRRREPAPLDLAPLAERVLETFAPQAAERAVTVALDCRGDLTLQGDAGELEIMLNNLVSNAIKYNREGGRVGVALAGDDEHITVTVRDTGIGMAADDLDRLFGEFVRIKNEKTSRIEGSGLGLSILRRLARLYGGDVTVASTPGEGSVFTLTLARGGAAPAVTP